MVIGMEAKNTVMSVEEMVDKTLEVNPCKSCQLAGSWTLACGYSHRGNRECAASKLFRSGCEAQAQITWDKMVEFLKAQKITTQNMQTSTNLYDAFGLEARLRDWTK